MIAVSGLEIIATFPYFLMILSIRKLSHLASNRQSTPETYIKYQIVIIFISKLIVLPFYLFVKTEKKRPEDAVNAVRTPGIHCGKYRVQVLITHLLYEAMTMPLMVQVAYLLSNKTNLESLKSSLTWGKNPLRRMDSKVDQKKVYTITDETETQV